MGWRWPGEETAGHPPPWWRSNAPAKRKRSGQIFVGNLAYTTTREELRQLFAAYGAVEHVHLVTERETGRSRGFAFVTMGNAPEARAAIAALQGTTCRGRTLTVTEARQREERHGPRRHIPSDLVVD